jgi:hypothetical protein
MRDSDFYFAVRQNITDSFINTAITKKTRGKNTIVGFWGEGGTGKSFSCMQFLGMTDPSFWDNIEDRVYWEIEDALRNQSKIHRKQDFFMDERMREYGLGSQFSGDQMRIIVETAREPMNNIGFCSIRPFDNRELMHYLLEGLFQYKNCAFFLVTRPLETGYLGVVGFKNPELTNPKGISKYLKLKQEYNNMVRDMTGGEDMVGVCAKQAMTSDIYKRMLQRGVKFQSSDYYQLACKLFPQFHGGNISKAIGEKIKFEEKLGVEPEPGPP